MNRIEESELIINPDGSIFHLHLLPDEIADTIILVGDQNRVQTVSSFFDTIEVKKQNREFNTHTGIFKGKRISVVSTGIGTDNIDIVINELDALVNIDLKTRLPKEQHTVLNFIRIGTSGALQGDIPVDTPVVSQIGIGFDGMINYYANREKINRQEIENKFISYMNWNPKLATPYFVDCSVALLEKIAFDMPKGMTISAPGFYGPQGRVLRLPIQDENINQKLTDFVFDGKKINNYEMECSAIYGLSKLLGHNALTICCIIANRIRKEYSKDYKVPVKELIKTVLNRIVE